MNENSNGSSAQATEGTQSVAGRLGVKPENRLSFCYNDERLKSKHKQNVAGQSEPESWRWDGGRLTFCV